MRIKKRISLTDKFVLLFIGMGVIAAISVSGIAYYIAGEAIMNRTFDQLTSVRTVKKRQIENYFKETEKDINLLTDIIEKTASYESTEAIRDHKNAILDSFITNNSSYDAYHIVASFEDLNESNGIKYIGQIPIRDTSFFIIEHTDHESELNLLLTVGSKIQFADSSSAFLLLEKNTVFINSLMAEEDSGSGFGLSGESYIVGFDSLMRTKSRFSSNAVMNVKVKSIGVEKALNGLSETGEFKDYRDVEVLSAYCKLNIKDLDWVLLAEIDLKEAMSPIDQIRNFILFQTISISLVVFIIAYYISRQISKPLNKLTEASKQIAGGNFDVEVSVKSNDEIGDLASAFSSMSKQLIIMNAELEAERLKQYSTAADAQELERERLSKELHDGIGQTIIALKLKMERFFDLTECSADESVKEIELAFDYAVDDIRNMSNDLTPNVLRIFGLENAVRKLCDNLKTDHKLDIVFSYDSKHTIKAKKTNIYIYRIVQEALNNIIKHSGAVKVLINIFDKNDKFVVMIEDNGIGFDTELRNTSSGAGLFNISERAKILNGIASIQSTLNKGTRVLTEIPLKSLNESEING